jgi:hypothetical protein
MDYEDFSIRISVGADGRYEVNVRSPAGTGDATLELPFGVDEVGGMVAGLSRSVSGDSSGSNGGSTKPARDIGVAGSVTPLDDPSAPARGVAEVGNQLYQALFKGKVQTLFDKSLGRIQPVPDLGLRIRLNLDLEDEGLRELARLPWEFLNDVVDQDHVFLNLSEDTPLVRDLDVEKPPEPLPFQPPLRVLVVIANPRGSAALNLDKEKEIIQKTFAELEGVEMKILEPATLGKLLDELDLEDYHVLHYMGHGDFDEEEGGVLLLEREDGGQDAVSGSRLAGILRDQADTVRLIFLNACKTATSSQEGARDPFGGVATSLIKAGIPAIVAMQFPITDDAAIVFSRTFYHRIVHGKPVDTAVAQARKYLNNTQPGTREWATPVLFMRCRDGVLFHLGTTTAPPDPALHRPEPPAPAQPMEIASPTEPVIPDGVDLEADFAVWLAEEDGNLTLHWRARSPGLRDFVALFPNQPTDPDGYLPDAYEYASQEGSYPTSVPARPGCWVAYIVEDASGEKTIVSSWGPTT